MKAESFYNRLPVILQNLACSYYGWRERRVRYGSAFQRDYFSLTGSDMATHDQISAYQDEQVKLLVDHAYRTVPYYRRVMEEWGLKPEDVQSRSDLSKLPILSKDIVIQNRESLLSTAFDIRKLKKGITSGTTGTALSFFTTPDAVAFQWAVWWRHRYRFGIKPFTWHVNFTGKPIVPISQKPPPYWRWNWPMRQALVNRQHLTPDKIREIANFLENQGFLFFVGYPSTVSEYCRLLIEEDINLFSNPNFVFLGGENTHDYQRSLIEKATQAIITDQYGFSEGCGNASRCPLGFYHEDWEFGFLECVDPEIIDNGQVRGRIIATGFANKAFPFIRYDVGDVGIWESGNFRCSCGRSSPVLTRIEGRSQDYVITPEGGRSMDFEYLFQDTRNIKEAQVIQRELGGIVIRVVARDSFTVSDEKRLREKVRVWVSPSLEVNFEHVKEIPRSPGGKFRLVVSELEQPKCGNI